jgi:epoxyqueuosine reductase
MFAPTDSANEALLAQIRAWAHGLGFSQIGVADVNLAHAEPGLQAWLAAGHHGSMHYMAAHGLKRARPNELISGTLSVITARMDYLPRQGPDDWVGVAWKDMKRALHGNVSVYARGRDYHKVLRSRLQKLAERIGEVVQPLGHRVFTDSAPVLEVELATQSGLGWRGQHSLALSREAGSMFFLGEIFVDVLLPRTAPVGNHCGTCTACIDICPTQAIVGAQRVDARRCISYLTIEHDGAIDEALRPQMGNRIYGCDDCQLACPWNKFAQRSTLADFDERPGLHDQPLAALLRWTDNDFLHRTEGTPIRRIGHLRWLRNVSVAAGNALAQRDDADLRRALDALSDHPSEMLREHVRWALAQAIKASV